MMGKHKKHHIPIMLLLIGGAAFGVTQLLWELLNPDVFNWSPQQELLWWTIRTLGLLGFTLSMFSGIFFGIRLLKMDKRDKYAMGLLGAGLFVFVVFLSCTFYSYRLTQDVTHLLNIDDNRLHEIQRIMDSLDPSLETHRRSSYLLAKETFVHHGELIDFTNEAGKEELFQPTKDDKEIRKTVSILKRARNSLRDTCILWASIFCVSLFVGMLMPLSKSRNVIPPIA